MIVLMPCLVINACTPRSEGQGQKKDLMTGSPEGTMPPLPTSVSAGASTMEGEPAMEKTYFRLNQVGYRLQDPKLAYLLTDEFIQPGSIHLIEQSSQQRIDFVPILVDQGPYGNFAHVMEIQFSDFQQPGFYQLQLGQVTSYPFKIAADVYAPLVPLSLKFFQAQRCGDEPVSGHTACHLQDGVIRGGNRAGQVLDVSGGWHDAGDYIKFSITSGYATYLLLHAAEINPDAAIAAQVLQESEVGMNWLSKLWDAEHKQLYYQVSDEADHEDWRMPEDDQLNPRPVYPCEPGKGANVAGKSAAGMALASQLYNQADAPWFDAMKAVVMLNTAREIYAFGKANPGIQPSNPSDFYTEETWQDDMALAAVELYRATGEPAYLTDAMLWLSAVEPGSGFSWGEMGSAAYYKAALADDTFKIDALKHLEADLNQAKDLSQTRLFSVGIDGFHWGSAETMASLALEAMWYEELTGLATYRQLAVSQLGYLLGANPWGISWVSGAGNQWTSNPHHQIADLTDSDLPGFWNEGAVPASVFEQDGPQALAETDEYALFQTEDAVYHDDSEDWVTNEPTITMNAIGIALSTWLSRP